MNGDSKEKIALNSYTEYLCELRWSLVTRDTIVEDRLILDLRHSAFRTYYRDTEDIRLVLGNISLEELMQIALFELHFLAELSDHGNITAPAILSTWLELNANWFLKAFKPLCAEAQDWTTSELQLTLQNQLAQTTGAP